MLTESREAMNLRNRRKTLQLHPYRRHTSTPTHFCLFRIAASRHWYFSSLPGLTRQSISFEESCEEGWMRGSSPRMTLRSDGASPALMGICRNSNQIDGAASIPLETRF
jgi:hypothetical protein